MDEQGFSSTYAQMCQVLSKMSVRGEGSDSSNSGKSEVKFRNLIINKCQKEFEKDNMEEFKATRRKEIDECSDVSEVCFCIFFMKTFVSSKIEESH